MKYLEVFEIFIIKTYILYSSSETEILKESENPQFYYTHFLLRSKNLHS